MAIWHGFVYILRELMVFCAHVTGDNWVLGVVLLTVIVRLVLLPLGVAQVRSFQKMARLGPRQRELQAKHKGNPQKMQEELSALYKEEGVNPAAGCLPLILQLPVMYGLFDAIRIYHFTSGQGLWIWQNLSKPDPYYVLPILVAISTFFMQRQSMQMTPSQPGMEQSQKLMLWLMPIMFGYIASRLSVGLSIYYVTSNLFQLGQTTVLLRRPQTPPSAPKKAST